MFYFDATGQVVKKLHEKRVLYYSMVVKETSLPVVPVLEFITDQHATHYIVRPLLLFKAAIGPRYKPIRVEVDFSWAIIHSTLMAFNNMNIHDYLVECHEICMEKKECHFTVLHVCCVHILRAVRVTAKEKVKDAGLRQVILRMMALLLNTTSMKETLSVWKVFCIALNNKKKTEAVRQAISKMNQMLKDASTKFLEDEEDYICTEGNI